MAFNSKVLILSYYWPPSGGSGVQRWLKMSRYLAELGVEVHVITVDPMDAAYPSLDASLNDDVSDRIHVERTPAFNPFSLAEKILGKTGIPTANSTVSSDAKWKQRIAAFIRSHLFLPDPRVGWKRQALNAASACIEREGIEVVITTSPPHSVQLIGHDLKKRHGIRWIADFRDPWTDIFYYDQMGHSALSRWIDRRLERRVLDGADAIVSVGEILSEMLMARMTTPRPEIMRVVYNGYDERDFEHNHPKGLRDPQTFVICSTGTIANSYRPESFFEALNIAKQRVPEIAVKVCMVGAISDDIKSTIEHQCADIEWVGLAPHSEVTKYQTDADLLLMVLPDIPSAKENISGKVFEYLRSGNPIVCLGILGGEASSVIESCRAGNTFERTQLNAMVECLVNAFQRHQASDHYAPNWTAIQKHSRKEQARQIRAILETT